MELVGHKLVGCGPIRIHVRESRSCKGPLLNALIATLGAELGSRRLLGGNLRLLLGRHFTTRRYRLGNVGIDVLADIDILRLRIVEGGYALEERRELLARLAVDGEHATQTLLLQSLQRLNDLLRMRTATAVEEDWLVIHLVAVCLEKNG